MILRKVYNSSGKEIGQLNIYDDRLEFINSKKGNFIITEAYIVECAKAPTYNVDIIKELYDKYTLLIGEIAAVFDVLYYRANRWTKELGESGKYCGRRNASYNKVFSDKRKNAISNSNKGKVVYNDGTKELFFKPGDTIPKGFVLGRLPFTESHRDKLRQAGLSGKFTSPSEIARRGWERGKYNHVNFKRGIGGYFTSIKMGKRFFFRSLLELFYLIKLEEDNSIISYKYESLRIKCDDKTVYIPDLIVNNNVVIELKSYNFVYKQGGSIQEKFEYKCEQGKKYCLEHNLIYKVVFDKDIGFDCGRFKHVLKESNYVQKYKIEFLQPERVWS